METMLLNALAKGDEKAFEKIYLNYYKKTLFFITGLTKSPDDAEELAQEVFIKLWTNRKNIDTTLPIHNYIYTIARNTTFNFIKHRLMELDYQNECPVSIETETSEEIFFAKEISLLIDMTVSRMPVQRQRIYRMSRNEGISNEEIATQLQISKKTVENQLSLALGELRKVILGFLLYFFA